MASSTTTIDNSETADDEMEDMEVGSTPEEGHSDGEHETESESEHGEQGEQL